MFFAWVCMVCMVSDHSLDLPLQMRRVIVQPQQVQAEVEVLHVVGALLHAAPAVPVHR